MQPVVKITTEFVVKPDLQSLYDPHSTSAATYPCMPAQEDAGSAALVAGDDRGSADDAEMSGIPRKSATIYDDESERDPQWGRPWGGNAAYVSEASPAKDIFCRFVMLAIIVGFMVINMYICGAFGKTGNWALVFCWLILLCPIFVMLMGIIISYFATWMEMEDHEGKASLLVAIIAFFIFFAFGVPYALYTARLRQADRYVDPARVKILSCYRDTFVPDYHINFYHLVDKEWNVSCAKRQYYKLSAEGTHYFYLLPMYYTGRATGNCKSPFLLSCYSKTLATCEQLVTTCFNYPPNSVSLKTINLNEEFWKMFIDGDSAAEAKYYIQKTKPKFTDPVDFYGVPVVYGSDDIDAFDEQRPKAKKVLTILWIVGMIVLVIFAVLWVVAPDGDALIYVLYPVAICCSVLSECC